MSFLHLNDSGRATEASSAPMLRRGTIAAAGANLAAATPITTAYDVVLVTASDGAKGVGLPASSPGTQITVLNSVSGQNLLVYPPSGGTINYGSTDGALTVGGRVSCTLIAYSGLAWYSVPTVPS